MDYSSHPKMKYLYIGVDCHKKTHTATIKNCFNENLKTITFNNDRNGYNYLIKCINELNLDLIPLFGLEDTKHLGYGLSSYLLSQNYLVKSVSSNLTYVERKKNPVIFKNDEFDSQCVAKVLLDEFDRLPDARNDEIYWTLKQMLKMRKSIVGSNINFKCKLHAQLLHHFPNYNKIFATIDCDTALALWEKYPNPKLILDEDFNTLKDFIIQASNNRLGLNKTQQIVNFCKEIHTQYIVYQQERDSIIRMIVKQIKDNNNRLKSIDDEIIKLYDKTNCKLHTFPGLNKIASAQMLSEIGNINRFKNSSSLARYAGIAPVEKSSGGIEKDLKNQYGNRDLNSMFYSLACRSISTGRSQETPYNPIFQEY